jgi:hypothetical protein
MFLNYFRDIWVSYFFVRKTVAISARAYLTNMNNLSNIQRRCTTDLSSSAKTVEHSFFTKKIDCIISRKKRKRKWIFGDTNK